MSRFSVVTIGDSVLWGQGLRTEQKMHFKVAHQIAKELGLPGKNVDIVFEAHSGAVIGRNSIASGFDKSVSLWQEVPKNHPTILRQVDDAATAAAEKSSEVNLVILNGGINDLNFRELFDIDVDEDELDQKIRDACYVRMLQLLRRTRAHFPNAVIIIAGYYPILSRESELDIVKIVVGLLTLVSEVLPLIGDYLVQRILRNIRFFHNRQLAWLRTAVSEMYEDNKQRGPGIYFAHPAFGPQHSVGARSALLFGPSKPDNLEEAWERFKDDPLTNILSLEPDDPVIAERRHVCGIFTKGFDLIQCKIASIGHPNINGANRYAEVIRKKFLDNHRISMKQNFSGFSRERNLSLKTIARAHQLVGNPISLRDFLQHVIVDAVEVTIKTKKVDSAGTDQDVFLRLGSGRQWRLNEGFFEGDTKNNFEQGTIDIFAIDPAAGDLQKRLHLDEISELSLILDTSFSPVEPLPEWKPEWIKLRLNGREVLFERINRTLDRDNPIWTSSKYPQRR